MAYINRNKIPAILRKGDKGDKGDNAFIRYSANADGTDFTEEWSEGQAYIGFATGQTAPTDKSGYSWCRIADMVNVVQGLGNSETDALSQKAATREFYKIRDAYCETEINVGEMTDGYYATGFGDIAVADDSSASGFIDLTNRHSNLIKFENLFARGSRACTLFNVNKERTRYILASSTDTEITLTLEEDEVYAQLTSFVGQKPIIRELNIIEAVSHKTVYVDGQGGNDSNNGSKTHPYKTIQKAVDSGAKTIFIIPMDYTETVTLTYKDGVSLYAWDYTDFSNEKPTKAMVHITGSTDKDIANGLVINKSSNIYMEDIWCDNTSSYPINITNSNNIEMNRCHASNSPAHGFCLVNVNGIFRDCMAWNIGDESVVHADGFNIHGYGNTEFINCVAHDCVDDGISHHDGCTGLIQGGEYYNCGKGGVASPTHGAQVNVYGVFSHDNAFGIYTALEVGKTQKDSIIANNLLYNNTSAGIYANGYTLRAFGNILRGNTKARISENGGVLFQYESNQ